MAFTTGIFFVALLCTARCSPLGETTVCESSSNVMPNVMPNVGLGQLGLNLPPSLLLQLLSQTLIPGLPVNTGIGATTVCDSLPNVGLPLLPNYGLPLPAQSTVCESAPNMSPLNIPLPYGLNLPGYVNNLPASTTVCESASNSISPMGLPLGLSGLGLPYSMQFAGLGLPLNASPFSGLPLNGLGLPLNGLGLPLNGLGRLAVSPFGLPIL